MSYGYIYEIKNQLDGKIYVGQTKYPKTRWNRHLRDSQKLTEKSHLYLAIRKYGQENFTFNVVLECLEKEELYSKEIELISLYKSNNSDFGYNMSTGGEFGGRGIKLSEERKKRLSNHWKGREISEETKAKISKANTGKVATEETKKKLSDSHKGCTPWNKGIKTNKPAWNTGLKFSSDENSNRCAAAAGTKPFICNETQKIYRSKSLAARELGSYVQAISLVLSGKRKHTKGFTLSYVSGDL